MEKKGVQDRPWGKVYAEREMSGKSGLTVKLDADSN